jgi:pimeloyl-ACP methyl ester carboxylesterase
MEEIDVPVAGGDLRVVVWPGDGPTVLAAHGVTANALSWAGVAASLAGRVRLVAPDLRGRARSAGLPGPYGMAAHAADLIAVADHLGLSRVALAGHSMGAFVATETAARHPSRVSSVLLVDGGLPLPVPAGTDVDDALHAVIGPAMARLSMTFDSLDAYCGYFRRNPALGRYWTPEIAAYVTRDFTGSGSSCLLEAVRADTRDMLTAPAPAGGLPLLWASRGLQDEERGLYSPSDVAGRDAELVPDVNHYTLLLGAGAERVADRIAETAAAVR